MGRIGALWAAPDASTGHLLTAMIDYIYALEGKPRPAGETTIMVISEQIRTWANEKLKDEKAPTS